MKIFLGYPREEISSADEVYSFLSNAGHSVWMDKHNLSGGDNWDSVRLEAQRDADFVVHLCSSAILTRRGPLLREIRDTMELLRDQPFNSNLALFVRLEDFRMPADLSSLHYIDYFDPDWRAQLTKAVATRQAQIASVYTAVPLSIVRQQQSGDDHASQSISATEKSPHFEQEARYIKYIENGLFWDYVNATIMTKTLDGFFSFERRLGRIEGEHSADFGPSWRQVTATEFFRRDDLVSIRIYHHWYGAGAAHPNHGILTLNAFGQNHGFVSLQRLLNYNEHAANAIMKECYDEIVKKNFDQNDIVSTLASLQDLQKQVWRNLENYNFDLEGITFNFAPYQVLAYAFGALEVTISWEAIRAVVDDALISLINQYLTNGVES